MKVYCYDEYGVEEILEITEQQILDRYWKLWRERMIKEYGEDSEHITEQNCIDEWCINNWAWEKK